MPSVAFASMLTDVSAGLLMVAAALLVASAVHDVACRTIPNWIPAVLALDGVALQLLSGHVLAGMAAGAVVFIGAALLWRRGLMGGGDVKLLAAAAIVVPSALAVSFILAVALAGGLLAVVYLVLRRVVPPPGPTRPVRYLARIARVERRRIQQCRSLPYACAIATGALFVLAGG